MDDLLRLFSLQDSNTRIVLAGTSLLGLAAGVIGSFAVLRRRSLVGDALAHSALPGICVAYFIVGERNFFAFLLGAFVFGVLGVLCIGFVRHATRVKEDAAIGLVLSSFFGLGIVLSRIIQNQPGGNRAGLDGFIFGKAASMVRQDVYFIAGAAVFILAVVALLFKELRLLCFDREFAGSQGWPVFLLDLALMFLICLCTIVGLPAVGVVLMAALLIIPGAAARFWTKSLGPTVLISGAIGLASCLFGAALSAALPGPVGGLSRGQPTGPLIVLTAATFFLISLLFSPERGVVASLARHVRLTRRVSLQNLLRSMYEVGERRGEPSGWCAERELGAARHWSKGELGKALGRAKRLGLVERQNDSYRLTGRGLFESASVVRAHRLWELYLTEAADVAPDQVDRDADAIEHVLPPSLLAGLEARLAADGRLPLRVPASSSPIGEGVR